MTELANEAGACLGPIEQSAQDYVLDAEKVAAPTKSDDAERVERTVLEVGEGF